MSTGCPHNAGRNLSGFSRRDFLLGAGASVGAASVISTPLAEAQPADTEADPFLENARVPFDGPHQAGIATPAQALLRVVAFQLFSNNDRESVRRLLKLWTEDARRLCRGQAPLGSLEPEMINKPANLTITCGFGARLFDIIGAADQRPSWLGPLPAFERDALDPRWGEADMVLQICSDDPLTLAFASRRMQLAALDFAQVSWVQEGFLNANGALRPDETPRNLFGQIDGTVNPHSKDEYDDYIWIDSEQDAPSWAHGGSCMVVRRISMDLDDWERLDRTSREVALGRALDTGAPLTGEREHDDADFDATDELGLPVIDPRSHMALAAPPADKPKQRLRRRAYNFDDPPQPGSPRTSDSGLVFVCFQQNPLRQFVEIQKRLDAGDRLNEWNTHIGSAVFIVPPGTSEDGPEHFWGQSLLET
ncbi:Dyp-type peroxidase [Corynebacterium sp. ES2775-CONJ]|uniref:Dyp-type peroxidase n=1 Tax=Corynebacterium sp. ES2775-CONJ TaxID=2974029 RepID=UPI002168196D|nr:Dyp-type peroxidase [Corynebacterium sp. ES2775-CONJ]MCS4489213.1 Dyp-type peroxidase [Corynebacterium sp. ES2775-CONJ]